MTVTGSVVIEIRRMLDLEPEEAAWLYEQLRSIHGQGFAGDPDYDPDAIEWRVLNKVAQVAKVDGR